MAEKAVKEIIPSAGGEALKLLPYATPKRVVREFNIKIGGKNVKCVTTKGERYTYLTVDGTEVYTDGLLDEGKSYKVQAIKEKEAA